MKRINLLYLATIPLLLAWFYLQQNMGNGSTKFYGFAENKETEISHEQAVHVHKIHVIPGQTVLKGQLLMEVSRSLIGHKMERIDLDLNHLEAVSRQSFQQLSHQLAQLQARRLEKSALWEAKISELSTAITHQKELLVGLSSISLGDQETDTPQQQELRHSREQYRLEMASIDLELQQIQQQRNSLRQPRQTRQNLLTHERDYLEQQTEQLQIIAPTDGIIGNILCKEGENIDALVTLVNFYEPRPTIVRGFVHESLILAVKEGDSIQVSSSLHPQMSIQGAVVGLGSRIIEIPERLRKIPDFKSYGREVLIRIAQDNPFLQKEKVMLHAFTGETPSFFAALPTKH